MAYCFVFPNLPQNCSALSIPVAHIELEQLVVPVDPARQVEVLDPLPAVHEGGVELPVQRDAPEGADGVFPLHRLAGDLPHLPPVGVEVLQGQAVAGGEPVAIPDEELLRPSSLGMAGAHTVIGVSGRKLEVRVEYLVPPEILEAEVVPPVRRQARDVETRHVALDERPEKGRVLAGIFTVNLRIAQPRDAKAEVDAGDGIAPVGVAAAEDEVLEAGILVQPRATLLAHEIAADLEP